MCLLLLSILNGRYVLSLKLLQCDIVSVLWSTRPSLIRGKVCDVWMHMKPSVIVHGGGGGVPTLTFWIPLFAWCQLYSYYLKYISGWCKTEKCPFNLPRLSQAADHTLSAVDWWPHRLPTTTWKLNESQCPAQVSLQMCFLSRSGEITPCRIFGFGQGSVNVLLCFQDEQEHQWYRTHIIVTTMAVCLQWYTWSFEHIRL